MLDFSFLQFNLVFILNVSSKVKEKKCLFLIKTTSSEISILQAICVRVNEFSNDHVFLFSFFFYVLNFGFLLLNYFYVK